MKNLLTIFFCFSIIIGKSQITELDSNMISSFEIFKKSQLENSCKVLTQISIFPIKGHIGLERLLGESDSVGVQMKNHKYGITKMLLEKNCKFLNYPETLVLKGLTYSLDSKGVKYKDCFYKGTFYVGKDKTKFRWYVGCVDLIDQVIGEYTIIFTFSLKNGKYYLSQIQGAG